MTAGAKVYLALGVAALVVWWAYKNQAINPVVTETGGNVATGGQS